MANRNNKMSREKSSIDFTMNMEDSKIDEEAQDHKKQDQKKDLFDGHSGKTIWVQMALFGNGDGMSQPAI